MQLLCPLCRSQGARDNDRDGLNVNCTPCFHVFDPQLLVMFQEAVESLGGRASIEGNESLEVGLDVGWTLGWDKPWGGMDFAQPHFLLIHCFLVVDTV